MLGGNQAVSIKVPEDIIGGVSSNGNIYTDGCSSLTGWTNNDGDGATTQETFDSKSTFNLLASATPSPTNHAHITRDVGSFGARLTFTIDIYPELLGLRADNDRFLIQLQTSTHFIWLSFSTDNLMYLNAAISWIDTGVTVEQDGWTRWTFDINTATGATDIYKGLATTPTATIANILTQVGIRTDGQVDLWSRGYTTASIQTYINYLKFGDSLV